MGVVKTGADQWLVYPHYEIVDDRIVGFGSLSNTRSYNPLDHLELPSVLAKVDVSDQSEILEFVHQYGLLGGSSGDTGSWQEAEPIRWFQEQAMVTKLLLELVKCSLDNDEARASDICRSNEPSGDTFGGIKKSVLVCRTDDYDVPSGLVSDTPLGQVRYMASAIINSNIRGISRKATPLIDGVKSSFYFTSLLDVISWQLLNSLEGGISVAECATCHTPFIKTDGRQRFCPKRYGEAESRCALLYRQRKRLNKLNG